MLPVNENAALRVTNPYGRTKLIIEDILRDLYASDKDFWRIMILRCVHVTYKWRERYTNGESIPFFCAPFFLLRAFFLLFALASVYQRSLLLFDLCLISFTPFLYPCDCALAPAHP
jgi:nucleoside-diphosphate-sugar epimerase